MKEFIKNKKKELNLTEKFITNNPISYKNNKEIYFYTQIDFFINNFNEKNLYKRKYFLTQNEKVINYFKNEFPKDEKEIDSLIFTLNFGQEGDKILNSFSTFLNKPLSIKEMENIIKNSNKNINSIK